MIFDTILAILLVGILAWAWTCAAYLRHISGQLNSLILEIQELARKSATQL
jgi:hypothetical protein